MSEDKIKRRRFLADILFAGGGLTAAAFLAKAQFGQAPPTEPPQTCETPSTCPSPDIDGNAVPPTEPHPAGAVAPPQPEEPQLEGKVAQPVQIKGDVAVPDDRLEGR